MLFEAGKLGQGSNSMISGTAGPLDAHFNKSVLSMPLFDADSRVYAGNNGDEGMKIHMEAAMEGFEIKKGWAQNLGDDIIRPVDGLVVARRGNIRNLESEVARYESIGLRDDLIILPKDRLTEQFGLTVFDRGCLIPGECVISPPTHIQKMVNVMRFANSDGNSNVSIVDETPVTGIKDTGDGVTIMTGNRGDIRADYVILATNGFFNKGLNGLLQNIMSFMVVYKNDGPNLPYIWTFASNFFYFTRQDGVLYVGGHDLPVVENNFASHPREQDAIKKLMRFANYVFPETRGQHPQMHYGVFAYTPDSKPIFGKFHRGSKVVHMVGGTGVDQAMITYAASKVPSMLGYEKPAKKDRIRIDYLSPARFTNSVQLRAA